MQNENTPTEGQNSNKLEAESALRDAACCALDLYRLPITGVDTVEDTDQLARRIIHEWRKTRDEYRPDVLMVDLNSDLFLYRILKAEGIPVAALPEAESRNRRAAQNRPCSRYVPSWMRDSTPPPPREVMYAIGTEHRPNEFGMWKGPVPDVSDMMETAGSTLNDVIICFNADWTEDVLWRWDGAGWALQSLANA
jgi:hypothetical protein